MRFLKGNGSVGQKNPDLHDGREAPPCGQQEGKDAFEEPGAVRRPSHGEARPARGRLVTRGWFLPAGALAAALLAGCGALPPTAPPASFAPVLTRALPSVVGIYALQRREDCEGADAATRDIDEPQVGAGFVIDREGRIATAAHIIDEAECIVVRYADGRVAEARPLVVDRPSDIAVLAAPAGIAPAAPVGRSAALRPGDWVLAVGEPFGLGRSVAP
ncbi:MAG: serine protease, partial [Aquabacterium sp.]